MTKIAALFVRTNGCYFNLVDVDPWDVTRDARTYDGPYPVVAHPPCERWGRYWYGGPMLHKQGKRKKLGDDDGCFASALSSVRKFSGVLEHPEGSAAWRHHGMIPPLRGGGWSVADNCGGWTCCVDQGEYGHRARKATWLYANRVELPSLRWHTKSGDYIRLDQGCHSTEERRTKHIYTGPRMPTWERAATPIPFRDLLISIARSARATP